jgi:hypothetical protein
LGSPSGVKVAVGSAKEVESRQKKGRSKDLERCVESPREQLRKVKKCEEVVAEKVERAPGTLSGDAGDVFVD